MSICKNNIVFKTITLAIVCLFLVNDIAWAQDYPSCQISSNATTLAGQSRLKPFFEKQGLDFQDIALVTMAAGELKDLITVKKLREGPLYAKIESLNKLFPDGDIEIEKQIKTGIFKSSQKEYKYAVFHFKKPQKTINALFLEDHANLTPAELAELNIQNVEKHHLDCPGLEGVWFVNILPQPIRSEKKIEKIASSYDRPFPLLSNSNRIKTNQLLEELTAKYTLHNLLRAGPISQPGFFVAFRRDENIIEKMKARYAGRGAVEDLSYRAVLANPEDIRDFKSVMSDFLSGKIATSLIYKPNKSSQGQRVVFFERGEKSVVITMAYDGEEGFWYSDASKQVYSYLTTSGVRRVSKDADRGIMQFTIDLSRKDIVDLICGFWEILSTRYLADHYGSYDSGTMEEALPFVKHHGKAYETRHRFSGNLLTGKVVLKKHEKKGEEAGPIKHEITGPDAWFARIGKSGYFTRGDDIYGKDIFNPLYERFGVSKARRKIFEAYVDTLIKEEFRYLTARLKANGINIDVEIGGQFDLMWLAPEEKDGFPKPVIIETAIHRANSDYKDIMVPNMARPENNHVDGAPRDMKGAKAGGSNTVIREIFANNDIVEIEYDGKKLNGWKVKDLKDKYRPGVTPKHGKNGYRGAPINMDILFTPWEQERLVDWIRFNTIRSHYVIFRIALNEIALKWKKNSKYSNIAHAGYRDRCIYMGEYFLKYLLKGDRFKMREKVFTDDELWHLQNENNKEHSTEDPSRPAIKKEVEDAIIKIRAAIKNEKRYRDHRIWKEGVVTSKYLNDFYDEIVLMKIFKILEPLRSSTIDLSSHFSENFMTSYKDILLTEKIGYAEDYLRMEALKLLQKKITRYSALERIIFPSGAYEMYHAVNRIFGYEILSEENDESLVQKLLFLDLPSLYALLRVVLKDEYIRGNIEKISKGAAINLKLKAYYLLTHDHMSSEKVIEYLHGRIRECLKREERLMDQPSIGCEVEMCDLPSDYNTKGVKLMARILDINLGKDDMEFAPQPARDWRDVAETIDTMKGLNMIPRQGGEAHSLHISIGNPYGTPVTEYKENMGLITFVEGFLTSTNERLRHDLAANHTWRGESDADIDTVVRGELQKCGSITQYIIGSVASDNRLEFSKANDKTGYRQALRIIQLLHTALIAYAREEKRNRQDKLLSDIYRKFQKEVSDFLKQNKLSHFLYPKGKYYIEKTESMYALYEARTPVLRRALDAIVEKYLVMIEDVRDDNALARAPPLTREDKKLDAILSDHDMNIKIAYIKLASLLKDLGYDIKADTPSSVMKQKIKVANVWDVVPYPSKGNVGVVVGDVPGSELFGLAAIKKDVEANFLYFVPDRYVFIAKTEQDSKDSGYASIRCAVIVDKSGRLRMVKFKDPVLLNALVADEQTTAIYNNLDTHQLDFTNPLEFIEDKAQFSRFLKKYNLPSPKSAVLKGNLSREDLREKIKDFIYRRHVENFVLKPTIGQEGDLVKMFDKNGIDRAINHALMILERGGDLLIQERMLSNEWRDGKDRIDWNFRALSTWNFDTNNESAIINPDMIEVRYKKFDSNPVNLAKGAEAISLNEFFEKRKYTPGERKKVIKDVTALIGSTARCFLRELKRRGEYHQLPHLIGWDIMQSEDGYWRVIEANTGEVGGIQTLEKIYNKRDPERRYGAVTPVIEYLSKYIEGNLPYRPRRPADYVEFNNARESYISVNANLLANLGYNYIGVNDRRAVIIFKKAVQLNEMADGVWNGLGVALYNLGDYKGSENALRRSVELNKFDKSHWVNLADALYAAKKYNKAAKASRRALRIDGSCKEARQLLSKALSMANKERAAKPRKMPSGSIRSVLEYLCHADITTPEKALTIDEMGSKDRLNRAYDTLKYDIRGLFFRLQLIKKVSDAGRDAKYYVPESVKKKIAKILPELAQFRGDNLRPAANILDTVYLKQIKPILDVSEEVPQPSIAGLPATELFAAQNEAARIHAENLKYTPAISEKTILCHIITDSILPQGQRNMLKTLEKNMRGKEYGEKVVSFSIDGNDNFVDKLKAALARLREEYKGYTVQFDVACPDIETVSNVLGGNLGIKALAFEPCEEADDIAQVEGIILALRALHSDKIENLREAFRTLAGKDLPPEISAITDIDEFIKRITFILPKSKVIDYNHRRQLNEIIRKKIEAAA